MANVGIPSGGQFPSKGELNSMLSNFFEGGKDFAVDRRTKMGKQADRVYSGDLNQHDIGMVSAGEYYSPSDYAPPAQFEANENVIFNAGGDNSAFMQKDIPTSSTNYSRPRTVAAGYDAERQTMTVVFRDGTFYNYYEVTQSEWDAFRASYSKGNPWLNKANSNQASDGLFIHKPRGNAGDMGKIDPAIREALYRVARTFQQVTPPKAGRTKQTVQLYRTSKAGKTYKYGKAQVLNGAKAPASKAHKPPTGKRKAS